MLNILFVPLVLSKVNLPTPSSITTSPAKVAFLSPFKVRIAALSEFLLNVKLPPVPDVFPNSIAASEPEAAEVNLKYFAAPVFILPAKVAPLLVISNLS